MAVSSKKYVKHYPNPLTSNLALAFSENWPVFIMLKLAVSS
jgi:hypothetical protein